MIEVTAVPHNGCAKFTARFGLAAMTFVNSPLGRQLQPALEDRVVREETAELLADGKVVGWFQGGSEFGPRALGSRSIIADPRSEKMQKILNLKIIHSKDSLFRYANNRFNF